LTSSKDREIAESLAILCRKQGDTMRAIDLYVKVLVELAKSQVVSALYVTQGEIPFVPINNYGDEQAG
jgi:hypothetical protein